MKKKLRHEKILALVFLFSLLFPSPAQALRQYTSNCAQFPQKIGYAPGELLIKFKPSVRFPSADAYAKNLGISTIHNFRRLGVRHIKLPGEMNVEQALAFFLNDPNIEHVEPNYIYHATMTVTPNDTHFGELWGLHNTGQNVNGTSGTEDADMDAPEAWDITTGDGSVVVAVIDTGVDYNHPDLSANIWTNQGETAGNGVDDDENLKIDDVRGWDFVDNDNNPMDSDGHGTHVAGTIAAVGNNNKGVTGVSWTTKIMPLRVLNTEGWGFGNNIISAIEYANEKGAHVINLSLGGGDYDQFLKDAIDASPAVVVCAAGNSALNNDSTPHYPSSYASANLIAVAATDQDDNLAPFSCYGAASVDVAAPGVNIFSTVPARQTVWTDNFDDGEMNDWTTGGTTNSWSTTASKHYSGSYSLATNPDGGYQNNMDSWAMSPGIDLSSHAGVKLELMIQGDSQFDTDWLEFDVSLDGTTWDPISGISGSGVSGSIRGYWHSETFDLRHYEGHSTVYIRFHFTSNESITGGGWYIDDVIVTASSSTYNGSEYQYLQGTSMGAPQVAGLAALIKGGNPFLTNTEIKALIENNVDVKPSLIGKVATGGRVNAYSALSMLPPPVYLAPTSGPPIGGILTTLTGFNFGNTQGIGSVKFDGIAASSYPGWSDTQIVCVTPPHAVGAADVLVATDNGLNITISRGFLYKIIPGDIDFSMAIDLRDAVSALQVSAGISLTTPVHKDTDVNGDEKIGVEEAIYAIQKIIQLRNQAPILNTIGNRTVDEGATLTFIISAIDPEEDTLAYSASNLPDGASFSPGERLFSWIPAHFQIGEHTVTFIVTDNYGNSSFETITVMVTELTTYAATEFFPLNVGNWWNYKDDSTGEVSQSHIAGTELVNGTITKIYQHASGVREYFSSDSNGIQLYRIFDPALRTFDPDIDDIIFDGPLLFMRNNARVGDTEISRTTSTISMGEIEIEATAELLGIEDVTTENTILRDCLKLSVETRVYVKDLSFWIPMGKEIRWLFKGVGIVKKETGSEGSRTITASDVNGINRTY